MIKRAKRKKRSLITLKKQETKPDLGLLFLVIGLTIFGVLMVYNASVVEALRDFHDKYYYLKNQALWAIIGLGLMIFTSFINYKFFSRTAPLLFFINLILLVLVVIPGIGIQIKGARRWLNLGILFFQPTELIKLTFSIYLATWLAKKRSFFQFLFLIALLLFLIMLEPDLGTAIVVMTTGFLIYFLSGASLLYLFPIGLIGLLSGLVIIFSSPYRKSRLTTFLNPTQDPLGSSYHIRQVLIALGSGGFFGLGLGQSRQKYEYLPEAATDSIFAIIAEETGFIGATLVVLSLLAVVYKGFKIAKRAPDLFAKLLASGISIWIGVQMAINLSAMVALVPLTGLPLPFISYGGSSLIVILIAMGILLNISKFRVIKK